jgi:hypothetical protein
LLQISQYNAIQELKKRADFLYSAMEKHCDMQKKDKKPDL